MKASEIQFGVEYAVSRSTRPSSSELRKFRATGVVQKRVSNTSTYGSRMATVVEGVMWTFDGAEVETHWEPKNIHMTWAEAEAKKVAQRERAEADAKYRAEQEKKREPLVATYEAARAAAGLSPLYEFSRESLVRRGTVEHLSIDDLVTLLEAARKAGFAEGMEMADAAEEAGRLAVETERRRETQEVEV